MRKLKNSMVLLLCLGLLVLGAAIPYLAAWITDSMEADSPVFAQMESIQLNLEAERQELTMPEKLGLMLVGDSLPVTEDETRLMESDLHAIVFELMAPFQAQGLLPEPDNDYLDASSVLLYDMEDPTSYVVVWYVLLSFDSISGDTLTLTIDDETGLLLSADYIHYEEYVPAKRLSTLLDEMCWYYLNMHEIAPEEIFYGENALTTPVTPALWCRIPDGHGSVIVEMSVNPQGFYIHPVILD